MNLNFRLSHPGMWWGLALLIGPFFFGCSKQDFEEVEITETWTEPETIYSVDCEELGLNLADSCTVDFGELGVASGVVTEECTCDAEINGEQITLSFVSEMPWYTAITVESTPPFIDGVSSFTISSGMTLQMYLYPEGTSECVITVTYTCPGGTLVLPDIVLTGSPINGAVGPLLIEC